MPRIRRQSDCTYHLRCLRSEGDLKLSMIPYHCTRSRFQPATPDFLVYSDLRTVMHRPGKCNDNDRLNATLVFVPIFCFVASLTVTVFHYIQVEHYIKVDNRNEIMLQFGLLQHMHPLSIQCSVIMFTTREQQGCHPKLLIHQL